MTQSMLLTDCGRPDNPIVFANEDFHKLTQYAKEEVIGFNCRFLQGKHTNQKTVAAIREAVKEGKDLHVQILNYRKDGTPFINDFMMFPVHTSKKSNTCYSLHFRSKRC